MEQDETKRRMMVDLIPYIVSVYLRAQSAISPAGLLSKALESSGNASSGGPSRREELTAALRGVEELNLRQEGDGFVFDLDRKMMLDIVRLHVTKAYIHEGSHGAAYVVDPPSFGYPLDAALRLPMRSVFVKLLDSEVTTDVEADILEVAVKLSPSQLWVFTLGNPNVDSRLSPQFRSENRVLFGRLRILGLKTVLDEYLGGAYTLDVKKGEKGYQVKATPGRSAQA